MPSQTVLEPDHDMSPGVEYFRPLAVLEEGETHHDIRKSVF
jgi:hypothetical protein